MNPYDPSLWNKIVKGKQITIFFYVDEGKVSHKSARIVDEAISWLCHDYEIILEDESRAMVVHQGVYINTLA